MSPSEHISEDDKAEAGEYVLRLLSASERKRFEARAGSDPRLRDLVRDWEEGLTALVSDVAPVAAPAHCKAALDSRLFGPGQQRPRQSIWQAIAGLALVSTAALAIFVGMNWQALSPRRGDNVPVGAPAVASYLGQIAAEDASLSVVAAYDPATGALHLNRTRGGAPADRALELWLIGDSGQPVSLGVLPEQATATLSVPQSLREQIASGVLAISDEPAGGSPTGLPTGAVLATGKVARI